MSKPKVLIVDDDQHLRMLYQAELEDEHYEVFIASSGKEALEFFEKETPDIVTLDILMPGMDGIEVLRRMKEKKPNLPVIMSTAYDYRDDFSVWASDAYVVKSADLTELKSTIKTLLARK
ncbi:response regulator [Candidatus Magnetomonas plexicatena]|uniref:response regulator n=1 Tax=Candidatus Magnetomonas plexicatena TaxID=2552947 RepID=UPI001C75EF7A|nr:response regulator [Nitrospirales bacterium LBB_01]